MKTLEESLNGKKAVAIVCNQWGDTGKGKFVDFFSEWADLIVRGTGGANAGHTIKIRNTTHIFHLIPSGIIYDQRGKTNIIGNGVAFDPRAALEEIRLLNESNIPYNYLRISQNAKLVLPQHLVMDRIKEAKAGSGKIGTTGRGIGPIYTDHYARVGLVVNDMLNLDVFARKLKRNLADKLILLKDADQEAIKQIMDHAHLENGEFYDSKKIFDTDAIIETYARYGRKLRELITDTDSLVQTQRKRGARILLEGAQGHMLSIDYGSYPFVTSSDCSIQGLTKGCGLKETDVDLVLGIVKAFYMTRVGEGPFPTELGGEDSAKWCSSHTREDEQKQYSHASVNDPNEFAQGIAIRRAGSEYGATTGRPRRTGWLDLPLLKYATRTNGKNIIMTKLDVLDDCDAIKVCNGYVYEGPEYNLGNRVLRNGESLSEAVPDIEVMNHCRPSYVVFPGWNSVISGCKEYEELPANLKDIIKYVERSVGVDAKILSVGPERAQTILR